MFMRVHQVGLDTQGYERTHFSFDSAPHICKFDRNEPAKCSSLPTTLLLPYPITAQTTSCFPPIQEQGIMLKFVHMVIADSLYCSSNHMLIRRW